MNKPTLCDRCDNAPFCLLNFDGKPCRKVRTVEPTNYDLLISKTPEELAEWIESIEPAACPWRDDHGDNCRFTNCHDCWLGWLKAPVEVVDNG